jgi:AcrR family transcriptional regulator
LVAAPASLTAGPARGRPRDARVDRAVLTAALELLREGGVTGLSMDLLATRANVGKATIYRRWESKEHLVLDALRSAMEPIEAPDTGALRSDLEGLLERVFERFGSGHLSDVLPLLISAAAHDDALEASLEAYLHSRREPLLQVLERAVERGELAPDIDRDLFVEVVMGPALFRRLVTSGPLDAAYAHRLLDWVLGHAQPRLGGV